MSWIHLWEAIRHFLPKNLPSNNWQFSWWERRKRQNWRAEKQARKQSERTGELARENKAPNEDTYCKAVLARWVHLRGGGKKGRKKEDDDEDVTDWQMIVIKVRTSWPFKCGRATWEGIIKLSAIPSETQLFSPNLPMLQKKKTHKKHNPKSLLLLLESLWPLWPPATTGC